MSNTKDAVVAVWFRSDLRLQDHPALYHAMQYAKENDCALLFFFHVHPALSKTFTKRHDYFFRSLAAVRKTAADLKCPVHVVSGELEEAFATIQSSVKSWQAVFYNKDDVGFGKQRDEKAEAWFSKQSIKSHTFEDSHLVGPYDIEKKSGGPYLVFSSYLKAWRDIDKPVPLSIEEEELESLAWRKTTLDTEGEKVLGDLLGKCEMPWKHTGEDAARKRMRAFMNKAITGYHEKRDFPAIAGTSRLSPYLKNGVLSIRTLHHEALRVLEKTSATKQVDTYIQELAWRDFYYMVHVHHPDSKDNEIDANYRGIPWTTNEEWLDRWKTGTTGFPIVDAAMRQLEKTGWMHNRLRMVVASFLTKDLLIDWRVGERFFEESLIDYDASSNIGGWQWAASTGTDAVPYFRVFNPTRQSERFDDEGDFIRAYVPELKNVSNAHIHAPETMSEEEQQEAGCILGKDYPKPMVDHKARRHIVLDTFKQVKEKNKQEKEGEAND
ncbi:cryptochrome/photolyase family protein [Aureibacillus halotolerans]|uniref:Deoxyribodipyrimidine photo-lyase n=1 Tax=Aureibacillus halotolerans TaxID=1508390 RepID=A0A4R6U8B6_9BACI|nr:deoxyribodipyrimidine photo-lyase [Aureibacillus halotolerans]TDQ41019.1 deoxyribodipyrimidine photo-lyase type I [Aureibacillus halotolerans]